MSLEASVSKLSGPVKDLVTTSIETDATLTGKTDTDQAEVSRWLDKVGEGDIIKPENFKTLDTQMVPKTYAVNNYLTAADVALYGALHPSFAQLQPSQYFSHPALTRYFDHIQASSFVRASAEKLSAFPLVSLEFANAPKAERIPDAPKIKKEKIPVAAATPAVATTSESAPTTSEPKSQKKETKEKHKKDGEASKKGSKAPAAPAVDDGDPIPSMVDLRVGHIVDVKKHPDADGLYIEQIDIGEPDGPRTVVSGLVNYIPIEDMQDKYLIAVCNLKPANMRGVKSFAMVLAATHKDGKDGGVELVQPPPGSKPGDRVYFEGEEFEGKTPLPQLNPKKKVFETVQPGFTTLDTREAAWINPVTKKAHKIRTKEGVCLAPTFVGASLS